MSKLKSDFLQELAARGYVHQATDEAGLDLLTRAERVTGYIGFDCTAPSLHVGNLLSIMMLRKMQQNAKGQKGQQQQQKQMTDQQMRE